MSTRIQIIEDETVGAAALSQYACVKTAGALVVSAADTDVIRGFIQQDAAATEANVKIVSYGQTKAIASGNITKGARVCPDASGKIKAAVVGDLVCGYALEEAGANNDVIEIFVTLQNAPVLA